MLTFKLARYRVQYHTLGIPVRCTIVTIRSVRGKVQTSSDIMRLIQDDGPKKEITGIPCRDRSLECRIFTACLVPLAACCSCQPERESETAKEAHPRLTAMPNKGKPAGAPPPPRGLPNITIVPTYYILTVQCGITSAISRPL